MAVEQFDGKVEVRNTSGSSVLITLNGDSGNITAGAREADGDLVLRAATRPPGGSVRVVDRMHFNAGKGNIWLGGNGADGDIVIFPRDATNRGENSSVNEATIHLDGDRGDVRLAGGLKSKDGPERVSPVERFIRSSDEGAKWAGQSDQRFGLIEFTHEHEPAPGDREKLRSIWVFNPLLHANSIVLTTSHAGGPCVPTISRYRGANAPGGCDRFIDIHMVRMLPPGNDVRILYWIMN